MTTLTHKAVPGRPFQTIVRYNLPYWKQYLAGTLLSLVYVLVGLAMPFVIRAVVARFSAGAVTGGWLALCFWGLIGIAVVTGVARYWERKLIIGASRKCEYDLRNDFFRHIQGLSQEFFHRNQTGDLMARATNDLNYVRMFIGPGVMGTIDMVRVPLTLAAMGFFSMRLTALSFLPLPLVSLLVYAAVTYMHRQSQKVQDQYAVVTSRVQENLAGARVVQAYGVEDREIEAFREESEKYLRENVKLAWGMSLAWPLVGFTVGLMILVVLWRGGLMVIEGTLLLKDLTGFVVALLMLIWPLADFGWILTLYQRGAVGMGRMNEIFAEVPAIRDDADTLPGARVVHGGVRFEHVDFSYRGYPVLHDIDFEAPAGRTVAIVGPTGSGKSTLVALLTRQYDPLAGRILIDGTDMRCLPVHALRAAIGYVPQETFLFSDTIRENLAFGAPNATQEGLDYACEVAQFTETLEQLPDGYDTLLGERGVNLSGGQKQRLAIARAVLLDPKILVLDDALSSVDTQTEERILRKLKRVTAERTSFVISHRISSVKHADLILVLEDGRIVERGTHEDLLAHGGLYAYLHERQLLEEELDHA